MREWEGKEKRPLPPLALLAGGMATRMRPATLRIAKSMLPVAGEPFLGHQLRMLASQGVRDVVICCGHLEEQLRSYAGDGSRWGCRVCYSPDGEQPLGTGGALLKALPLLGEEFLVMYGDSYLPVEFAPIWEAFTRSRRDGLMTVYRNAGRWDTSNVCFEAGKLLRYSKTERDAAMCHIDYGLSCLRAKALAGWPEGVAFDLAAVLGRLGEGGELAGFEVAQRFYEIGSPAGLAELDAWLAGLPAQGADGSERSTGSNL